MLGHNLDFGEYGKEHGLIVVDMQPGFLKEPEDCMKEHTKILIRKIGSHVKDCIAAGGEVIFIEFDDEGQTIAHINNSVHRGFNSRNKLGELHRISKNANGVLSRYDSNSKHLDKNKSFFEGRKRKKYTVSGINTFFCVKECVTDLDSIGCNVRLDVGLTLNVNRIEKEQRIEKIKIPNRLIHAPARHPKFLPLFRDKSLLDYLYKA